MGKLVGRCREHPMSLDYMDEDDMERFRSKIDMSGDCWLWTAAKERGGYGRIGRLKAHQVAFALANGRRHRCLVRHTCDNPSCVNPAHLVEGTPLDNARDAIVRGRNIRGEDSHYAKLTEAEVAAIRIVRSKGAPLRMIANIFGVSEGQISMICAGLMWRHVA